MARLIKKSDAKKLTKGAKGMKLKSFEIADQRIKVAKFPIPGSRDNLYKFKYNEDYSWQESYIKAPHLKNAKDSFRRRNIRNLRR